MYVCNAQCDAHAMTDPDDVKFDGSYTDPLTKVSDQRNPAEQKQSITP